MDTSMTEQQQTTGEDAWAGEPMATAQELAAMTDARPEGQRLTLKAVRSRLDRGTLPHRKVGNLRLVPRSEALRHGLVTEAEWPASGTQRPADQHTHERVDAPPDPAPALAPGQQVAVVDMGGIVERVAELAAEAARGRLLTEQAGEREREAERERRLMASTINELRTEKLALEQRLEQMADAAADAERRARDLERRVMEAEASLDACRGALPGEEAEVVEVGERGGTVRQSSAGGSTFWGRLIGRAVIQ